MCCEGSVKLGKELVVVTGEGLRRHRIRRIRRIGRRRERVVVFWYM
jgi:hypothetical protein